MLVRSGIRAVLLALVALALCAPPALGAPTVSGEFPLKTEINTDNKLVQGPDGNIWVALNGPAEDVAKITPDGVVSEFELAVAGTSGIAVGPDGNLWATGPNGLTRFSPSDPSGNKETFPLTLEGASPIVSGPDGNLWIATKGKLLKATLAAAATPTEFPIVGLEPKDIDVAGSLLVIASFEHIYAANTAGAVIGDQKVSGQAQGVGGNPNGQYAFTQPVNTPKEIGLLSPMAAPIIRSAEGTDPFGITLGSDGAYWSAEFISDGLSRITADGTVSGITGFAKESQPRQIAAGPGNTLWVTLTKVGEPKVGRVVGLEPPVINPPPPPPTPEPRTKLKKGPKGKVLTTKARARVRFVFSSPDAGATFECRMIKVIRKKAKASKRKPKFKACKSPKAYKLKPGRYRFEVRAVLNGVRDKTPAKRSFKVIRVVRSH